MAEAYGKINHTDFVNIRQTPGGTIIGRLYPGNPFIYYTGESYTHNGKTWVSTVDNNVWEPGAYGWDEVTEA